MPDANHLIGAYLDGADQVLQRVRETQTEAIAQAAEICAEAILRHGLVHLFGTGHSRMAVEEVFPRYGSFPGFHPIVELSLTYHNQVVGANGQRQAMWIERQEGLGEIILRNFVFRSYDVMMVFSTSGTNGVVIDVALGAKARGMKVIAVVATEYSKLIPSGHSSGRKLLDIAVVNALKVVVPARLAEAGHLPLVLGSAFEMGAEASKQRFEDADDDYRDHVRVVYGG